MKKAIVFGLALALVGGVAYANFCARDVVPAATLLVPYVAVETDLSGVPTTSGQTTIFGITNVSRDAVIVHFTAWDATSVPRVDFDEILSGYDVLQINWRDFLNGRFDLFDTSKTAFTASTPYTFDPFEWGPDGRGQAGGLTTPANRNAITSAQCANVPPYGNRSDLAATIRGLLTGVLFARDHGGCDDPANLRSDQQSWPGTVTKNPIFFYVTADVVKACNLYFPNNTAYWADSIMTTNNVLIGDVIYLNAAQNYSEMYNAVHIEAAANVSREQVFPFYGEKTDAETRREPLGTAFAFRYGNTAAGNPDNIHSSVIFWKNFAEFNDDDSVNDCGSYLYYAWDMDERSLSRKTEPISGLPTGGLDHNQFPYETQKVPLNNSYFDLPAEYGWFLLVLPPSYTNSAGYVDPSDTVLNPTYNPYMGWAGLQFTYGTYSAGTEAATMANYHCFANQVLPALGANNGATYISYTGGTGGQ